MRRASRQCGWLGTRPGLYHYQERQDTYLKKLEKEGVIKEAGRPKTLEEVKLLL